MVDLTRGSQQSMVCAIKAGLARPFTNKGHQGYGPNTQQPTAPRPPSPLAAHARHARRRCGFSITLHAPIRLAEGVQQLSEIRPAGHEAQGARLHADSWVRGRAKQLTHVGLEWLAHEGFDQLALPCQLYTTAPHEFASPSPLAAIGGLEDLMTARKRAETQEACWHGTP